MEEGLERESGIDQIMCFYCFSMYTAGKENELACGERKIRIKRGAVVQFSQEQKTGDDMFPHPPKNDEWRRLGRS